MEQAKQKSTFEEKMAEAAAATAQRRGLDKPTRVRTANGVSVVKTTTGATVGGIELLGADYLDKVRGIFKDEMLKRIGELPEFKKKVQIQVVSGQKVVGKVDGLTHMMFETLVKSALIRGHNGLRKNIFLKGPMGSGKSTAAKQLAELLKLEFYYTGQVEMPSKVEGSVHPISGEYRMTEFVKAFSEGGVWVAEEMDAWSARSTLVLNPALANGYFTAPNGVTYERHKDCVIIACANTWGTGATTEYVGRNKLDAAFMDRFSPMLMWGYDPDLERAAANNDEVVDAVQIARHNAEKLGIKIPISPRSSINIADMVRHGFDIREAMDMDFLSACDDNQKSRVLEGTGF